MSLLLLVRGAFVSLLLLLLLLLIELSASAHGHTQLTAPPSDDDQPVELSSSSSFNNPSDIRKLQPSNNNGVSTSSSSPATYYFGHSLIYHALPTTALEGNSGNTNLNVFAVPYWMNQFWSGIQEENSHTTTVITPWYADGQFRTDNYQLPPSPNWGFQPDISNWQDGAAFQTLYDSVVYTELNFVQYREPWRTYETTGDASTTTTTPVESVVRILDYVVQTEQDDGDGSSSSVGPILYIYEGWMDAGGRVLDDISQTTTAQRNAYYAGNDWDSDYHHWWIQLMDQVRLERPNAKLALVPVAPILMNILSTYFPAASFSDLFEDSAPHGRPMLYFWASVILYLHMAPPTNNSNHTNLLVAVIERLATDFNMILPNVPISIVVESIASQVVVSTEAVTTTSSPPNMPPTTTTPPQPPSASPVSPPPTSMPPPTSPSQQPQLVDNFCCDQSIPEEGDEVTTTTCSTVEYCNQSMGNCQGDCEGRWVIQRHDERTTPRPSTNLAPPVAAPSQPPMEDTTTIVAQNCCEKEGSCSTIDYCNEAQVHCLDDCEGTWVVLSLNEEEEDSTLEGTTTTSSSAPSSNAKTSHASRLLGLQITLMGWLLLVVAG